MGHCNCKRHLEGYLNLHSISYGRGRNIKQWNINRVVEEGEGAERGWARGRRLVTFIKCVSVLFKIKAAEKRNAFQLQLKSSSKYAAPPASPVAHCVPLPLPSRSPLLSHFFTLLSWCNNAPTFMARNAGGSWQTNALRLSWHATASNASMPPGTASRHVPRRCILSLCVTC